VIGVGASLETFETFFCLELVPFSTSALLVWQRQWHLACKNNYLVILRGESSPTDTCNFRKECQLSSTDWDVHVCHFPEITLC